MRYKLIRFPNWLLVVVLLGLVFSPARVFAVDIDGTLVVDVKAAADEAPRPGAVVTVQDQNGARAPLTKATDNQGRVSFEHVQVGTYTLSVAQPGYEPDKGTVQITAGATATYHALLDVPGGEKVVKVKADVLLVNPHDPHQVAVHRDSNFIQNQVAGGDSLQNVLNTFPGVNTNSLGQVHVRGEHKSISLSMDGLNVPIPSESTTSQYIDPRFMDQLELRTGGYDSSDGGQLGAIINMTTLTGTQTPYMEFSPRVGDNGFADGLARIGGSSKDGNFNYFLGVDANRTDLYLEAPNPNFQNENNSHTGTNVLLRLVKKDDKNTFGLTLSNNDSNFGLVQNPQDFNAGVRQSEHDDNELGLFSWRHSLSEKSDLLFGVAYLNSINAVANNGVFTPFVPINPALVTVSPGLAGLPADPQNPGSPYLPVTNLAITEIQPTLEYSRHFGDDGLFKFGVTDNIINSHQSVNIVDAGGGGGLPGGVQTFNANITRSGYDQAVYVSETLPVTKSFIANFGLRAERFFDGATVDQASLNPLINLTYITSDTSAARLSYNRLFQAPPLEVDTSGNSTVFPQLADVFEASYEWQPTKHTVATVAAVYKNYKNQVDVALLVPFSNLPLFAPVNFGTGFYEGIDGSITTNNKTGFNEFLSATISEARPTSAGPFDTNVPDFNDHDERVEVTGGVSHRWIGGQSAEMDFLYGSGFPNDAVAAYNVIGISPFGLSGNRIPRLIVNAGFNFLPLTSDGRPRTGEGFGIQVQNLFDDRSVINFLSGFSGTRFVQQRRIVLTGKARW